MDNVQSKCTKRHVEATGKPRDMWELCALHHAGRPFDNLDALEASEPASDAGLGELDEHRVLQR